MTVSDSVYDRMRAERARVAADFRARGAEEGEKLRATADREAQVTLADAYKTAEGLKGEGDAKAADIYAKRSEEHTSALQSLMRITYAFFCLKQKRTKQQKD